MALEKLCNLRWLESIRTQGKHAWVALSVMAMTGCPFEFGNDGRIGKAVHKDAQEQIIVIKRCTEGKRKRVCARGNENSKECLECGGPP